MTIETVHITDRTPIPWRTKINPIWWLHGPDGWTVPSVNNGEPYLPTVTNDWLRKFYWFFARNPLMNFVGYVIGVEDKNYSVTGSSPVLKTTGRDCVPPQLGWRWAVIRAPLSMSWLGLSAMAVLATWLVSLWILPIVVFSLGRGVGLLTYVSYWGPLIGTNRNLEFYFGWRPNSGGFGLKLVATEKET